MARTSRSSSGSSWREGGQPARLPAALEAADLSYTARHYLEDGQPCLELAGPPGSPSFELYLTDGGVVDVTVRGGDPRPAGYSFTASRFGTLAPKLVALA